MKAIRLIILLLISVGGKSAMAQTLQQVTDNGATTNKGISVSQVTANAPSFAGVSIPVHIDMLNGYRINGSISNASHNGITYQSGGGGGAAISFFRGGSYDTGMDFYTNIDNLPGNLQHRMRIASNGNVGIGSTIPEAKLHIQSDANTSGAPSNSQVIIGGITNPEKRLSLAYNTSSNYAELQSQAYSGAYTAITLNPNGGNVGIGTNDPKDYRLAVNGKIRAKEIKVEASPWPDYVFTNSYSLPTLQETEKHIKEKGHLPGIPSAAEVKANGIDLGEMNAKLLQKIEELTLHLIEKDKELQKQNNMIKEQKDELELVKRHLLELTQVVMKMDVNTKPK